MGRCDRIKRDPPPAPSTHPVCDACAHGRLVHRQLRSRLHEQQVRLSAEGAPRFDDPRQLFLQTITSRIDTKRVAVMVLSAIVPTFFYASASARAHEPLARRQLRFRSSINSPAFFLVPLKMTKNRTLRPAFPASRWPVPLFSMISVDAPRRARGRNGSTFKCRKRPAPACIFTERAFSSKARPRPALPRRCSQEQETRSGSQRSWSRLDAPEPRSDFPAVTCQNFPAFRFSREVHFSKRAFSKTRILVHLFGKIM